MAGPLLLVFWFESGQSWSGHVRFYMGTTLTVDVPAHLTVRGER